MPSGKTANLYETLGVDRAASGGDIHAAYRRASKRAHPDAENGSAEAFALVKLAKDVLSDDAARAHYDATGEVEPPGPDQAESQAMQLAAAAIERVITDIAQRGGNPFTRDVVTEAVKWLKQQIADMRKKEREAVKAAKETRRFAKRFAGKDGAPNRLGAMFEAQAAGVDRAAVLAVAAVPAHEAAIDLLNEHTFERDEPDPIGTTIPGWFTTTAA